MSSSLKLAIEPLDEVRRSAYLGHLLLRIIDWPIRYGRTEEVEFWLSNSYDSFRPTTPSVVSAESGWVRTRAG